MTIQSWSQQISFFNNQYSCIMHDFRGQLLSDKLDGKYSMKFHAEDLLNLLNHLEIDKCHIVGTSYGGEVGMVFAYSYPERVKSLSIISSVSYVETLLKNQVESWVEISKVDPKIFYRVLATDSYSNKFLSANQELIELGMEKFGTLPKDFFVGFAHLVDAFIELNITKEISRITCPTLIICSENDNLKPISYSRVLKENILNSEFIIIPNAGHAVIIEEANLVNTILLGFLQSVN